MRRLSHRFGLPLLAATALLGCTMPKLPELPDVPVPKFSHAGEKQINRLAKELKAESFQVNGSFSIVNDSTTIYLAIDILNAEGLGQPDTLQPHLKRLARTVVRGLSNARQYQTVLVTVQENHDYVVASTQRSQSAEYSVKELQ